METTEELKNWLDELLEKSFFDVRDIKLKESEEWYLEEGHIRHRTGRFFKVIGVRWISPDNEIVEQAMLDQHEIGTLGFLVCKNEDKNQILVQAKIEPGNVGIIQLSPTCQATYSNSDCVHGGEKPPYSEYFGKFEGSFKYDLLQSEQGTRFFRKRNRNVLVVAKDKVENSKYHTWLDVDFLLDLLKNDYLVNTDARSVLVCSPWEVLTGRKPFTRYEDGFGKELSRSFNTYHLQKIKKVKNEITRRRCDFKEPSILPLDKINLNSDDKFQVKHIKVKTKGREVDSWDQPIISSNGKGIITLPCGRKDGILHFLFKPVCEPGLLNKCELTPYIALEPGEKKTKTNFKGKTILEVNQSEEGGRFFRDENIFKILDIGEAKEQKDGFWLTLGEIKRLLNEEGWFTNEARSALSLLLPWL